SGATAQRMGPESRTDRRRRFHHRDTGSAPAGNGIRRPEAHRHAGPGDSRWFRLPGHRPPHHCQSRPKGISRADHPRNPMKYRVEGNGPLLVSLPGLDGTGELVYKQTPGLAARYQVALFKLPDYEDFTYKDMADDVAATIRELGHQQATVVGESFGGTVALWFALLHPGLVQRLVIVNSFPRFRKRALLWIGLMLAHHAPRGFVWMMRSAGNSIGLLLDGIGREDRRHFYEAVRPIKLKGYARRLELIRDLDISDRISEIKAPALFIAAGRDLLVRSAREATAMAARMPNATVRVVPWAGHACLLGDKVSISDLLEEWIRGSEE